MNFTSAFRMGMGRAPNSTAFTFSDLLAVYGIPANANLSSIIPGVPPGFNASDPFVEAPFPPFRPPFFNRTSPIPGLPGGFNTSDPLVMSMLDGMLPTFVPGLPKDFKLSNVFVPGGIIINEMQILMDTILKNMGIENPMAAFGMSGHRVLARQMYQLGMQ